MKKSIAVAAVAAAVFAGSATGAVADSLIGSNDIKNNSIKSKDLRDGKAVGKKDLKPGLASKLGQAGKQGPVGPQGPVGEQGPAATVGISHWSEGATVPANGSIELVANCQQEGHLAISGGHTAGGYKGGVTTYLDRNTAGAPGTPEYGAGWIVGFTNTTATPQNVRTWVVCADVIEDEPAA